MIKMYDFIAIDFETANKHMNSACSIGIACVKDLEIVHTDYFLIKPPTDLFRYENTVINGLTYEDVKDADTFDLVYDKISHYFNECEYVFAHNVLFDMNVLAECLKTYNIERPSFTYIDSMNFSTRVCHGVGRKLIERCEFLGIPVENHHNALADAIMCANIVIYSIKRTRYKNIFTYISTTSRINLRKFTDLESKETTKFTRGRSSVRLSDFSPTANNFNSSHPLYQKNCVVTGEFESFERKALIQKLIDIGAIVKSGVSSKTNYLIVGQQDLKIVGVDGMSSKERKAHELMNKGLDIKLIYEKELLKLLNYK